MVTLNFESFLVHSEILITHSRSGNCYSDTDLSCSEIGAGRTSQLSHKRERRLSTSSISSQSTTASRERSKHKSRQHHERHHKRQKFGDDHPMRSTYQVILNLFWPFLWHIFMLLCALQLPFHIL